MALTGKIGNLMVALGLDSAQFEKGLANARKTLAGVGKSLESIGKELSLKVSVPLMGIGAVALKTSVDFNKAMANVATLIPGNIDRVNELKRGVQDLAIATGRSTGDLAAGLYQVISAFGDTADTMKILEINAKAAVGGLATTTEAINLTSAVTKAFGDTSAAAVQKVADLAQKTVKLGQTTFPELAEAIGKVTPLAKNLGVTMEEMFSVFAAATGVTGKASEVATQLRAFLQALMSPSKELTLLMETLGVKTGFAMIQQYGLGGSFGKVVEAAAAAGVPLQKYIGQVEGMTAALSIGVAQAEEYKRKFGEMKDATGESTRAYLEQTQGLNKLGFGMDVLRAKMEVWAQKLGDSMAPALADFANAMEPVVNAISRLCDSFAAADPGTQKLVVSLGFLTAALGPVLLVVGKLGGLIAAGFGVSGWAVLAGIAGVGLLAGTIYGLYEVFRDAFNAIRNIGEIFRDSWKTLSEGLADLWERAWNRIASFFTDKLNWIKDKAQGFADSLTGIFEKLAGDLVFYSIIPEMMAAINKTMDDGWLQVEERSTRAARAVTDTWGEVGREFTRSLKNMLDKGAFDLEDFANRVQNIFWRILEETIATGMRGLGGAVEGFFGGLFTGLWGGGGTWGGGWSEPYYEALATLQHGGVVTGPTLAYLGEAGTEYVLNERQMRGLLREGQGGGDFKITVINRTGVPAEAQAQRTGMKELEIYLDQVMSKTARAGGQFTKSLLEVTGTRIPPLTR